MLPGRFTDYPPLLVLFAKGLISEIILIMERLAGQRSTRQQKEIPRQREAIGGHEETGLIFSIQEAEEPEQAPRPDQSPEPWRELPQRGPE